jgi:hypothetical protein
MTSRGRRALQQACRLTGLPTVPARRAVTVRDLLTSTWGFGMHGAMFQAQFGDRSERDLRGAANARQRAVSLTGSAAGSNIRARSAGVACDANSSSLARAGNSAVTNRRCRSATAALSGS